MPAIESVEGIGPAYAASLSEANISTTEDLLEAAGTKTARATLADSTGISEALVLEWVNRADLMRVRGVGEEFSDLLEAAGVDTVRELRTRNPANLMARLAEVNEQRNLARRLPSETDVAGWIEHAKELPPAVEYQAASKPTALHAGDAARTQITHLWASASIWPVGACCGLARPQVAPRCARGAGRWRVQLPAGWTAIAAGSTSSVGPGRAPYLPTGQRAPPVPLAPSPSG